MKDAESNERRSSHTQHTRTWAQIARLSTEALAALDAGKVKDAHRIVTAIRGVALSADKEAVGVVSVARSG